MGSMTLKSAVFWLVGTALGIGASGTINIGCVPVDGPEQYVQEDESDISQDLLTERQSRIEAGPMANRPASTRLPAGGTVVNKVWDKYVDQQISQVLEKNARWGIRPCILGSPGCNMNMQLVDSTSTTASLQKSKTGDAIAADPVTWLSLPSVNSTSFETFRVDATGDSKFATGSCKVTLQYLKVDQYGTTVADTQTDVPFQNFWNDTYVDGMSAPSSDQWSNACGSNPDTSQAWLLDYAKKVEDERKDVVTCNCPYTNTGDPSCSAAEVDVAQPVFVFNIALFNNQAWYRAKVSCGNKYEAYSDFIAANYTKVSTGNTCGNEGEAAVPMEILYFDSNNNGSISEEEADPSNGSYIGGICHTLPFVMGLSTSNTLNLTNTVATDDVSPSFVYFSAAVPTTSGLTSSSSPQEASLAAPEATPTPPPSSALTFMPGESWQDNAASAVAGRFDLNGDGHQDIAVGAPDACVEHDPSSTTTCEGNLYNLASGKVYVVFGAKSHLPGRNDLATANLGLQPKSDTQSFAKGSPEGRASITLLGQQGNGRAGMALAGADFDGNTLGDLAVGAPSVTADATGADPVGGKVVVIFGKQWTNDFPYGDIPLDAMALRDIGIDAIEIQSSEIAGLFGRTISVGDLDGDSKAELIVGEPYGDVKKGRLYVFNGRDLASWRTSYNGTPIDAKLSAQVVITTDGKGGTLGWNAAVVKFNRDAYADLAVLVDSAPCTKGTGCVSGYRDEIRMFWGSNSSSPSGKFMPALESTSTSDSTVVVNADFTLALDQNDTDGLPGGAQLAAVPDVTSDASEELGIGTPYYDIGTTEDAGAAWVVLSRATPTGTLLLYSGMNYVSSQVVMFPGAVSNEYMGRSIDAAQGGKHDGWREVNLLIGNSGWNDTSSSYQSWDGRVLLATVNRGANATAWTGGVGFASTGAPAQWATLRVNDAMTLGRCAVLAGDVDRDMYQAPEVLMCAKGSATTGLTGCSETSGNCSSDDSDVGVGYVMYGSIANFDPM